MKLEKAIIYLQADVEGAGFADTNTLNEAKLLGIEALKAWKGYRETIYPIKGLMLPRETKD